MPSCIDCAADHNIVVVINFLVAVNSLLALLLADEPAATLAGFH